MMHDFALVPVLAIQHNNAACADGEDVQQPFLSNATTPHQDADCTSQQEQSGSDGLQASSGHKSDHQIAVMCGTCSQSVSVF